MSKGKSHFIVLKNEHGKVEQHPTKEWLRMNPQHVPAGIEYPSDRHITSHMLRHALKRAGWTLEIKDDRVLLIKPDENGDTSFVNEAWENGSENEDDLAKEDINEAVEVTFGLEQDLQSALCANITQLEPELKIVDGGKERVTEAGRIDITAMDSKGHMVIIELKAGMATPQVIARVLAYMGAVAEAEDKPVRGILVAGDFHKRVILATRAVTNLKLQKYSFQFTFEPVK